MSSRITLDMTLSGRAASRRVRPCLTTRALPQDSHPVSVDYVTLARHCASTLLVSAGLLCSQSLAAEPVLAKADVEQVASAGGPSARTTALRSLQPLLPLPPPPPLASTGTTAAAAAAAAMTSGASGAALLVEEAEELVLDVVQFFQHSVEAVESTVHHLQVVHALERMEGMPLNEVVDLRVLKAAMHPASSQLAADGDGEEPAAEQVSAAAAAHLDAALDAVAEWRLRDVVDVGKLADALQDVQFSGPLDSRALQREALRLRRTVHWEAVLEAVRPPALRQALVELGARSGGRPFADMDIRAAVSAVRLEAVREALAPPRSERSPAGHSLESSGMWTWESI